MLTGGFCLFGHRIKELKEDDTCRWCIHFATDQKVGRFQCRRFPPVKYNIAGGNVRTDFPPVSPDDWCGEFQRKANSSMRRFWVDPEDRY